MHGTLPIFLLFLLLFLILVFLLLFLLFVILLILLLAGTKCSTLADPRTPYGSSGRLHYHTI